MQYHVSNRTECQIEVIEAGFGNISASPLRAMSHEISVALTHPDVGIVRWLNGFDNCLDAIQAVVELPAEPSVWHSFDLMISVLGHSDSGLMATNVYIEFD